MINTYIGRMRKKNQQHEKGYISEEIYEFEGISFKINHRNF